MARRAGSTEVDLSCRIETGASLETGSAFSSSRSRRLLGALVLVGGCGGAASVRTPVGRPALADVGGAGRSVRALAWAGGPLLAVNRLDTVADGASAERPVTGAIEAVGRWTLALEGAAGVLAAGPELAVASEQAHPERAAAVLFAPGDATTPQAVRTPLWSTEYVVLADAAVCGREVALVGSFGGTLRVGDRVVSTGGQRDGFLARIDRTGRVVALVRMGGEGDDGLAAVDCRASELAAAGTFAAGAELGGRELPRISQRSPYSDAVVLRWRGDALQWTRVFGSTREDLVADLALTDSGEVAVVGTARGELATGDVTLTTEGLGDGYVARWAADGAPLGATRLGGPDYDGATRVLALGERLVIAGFFTGSADLGGPVLTARGADDAMLVTLDRGVPSAVAISGDGREEVIGLVRAGDALAAAIAHTAGFSAWGLVAPPPADALGGAALVTAPAP